MDNSPILPNIRIRKIKLKDFRNIKYAEIDFPGGKITEYVNGESSILGVYGQNGSGKSSLLMAINALRYALSGMSLPYPLFSSCIRSGCESTRLEFEFAGYDEKGIQYDIYYSFSLQMDFRIDEEDNSSRIINAFNEIGLDNPFSKKRIDIMERLIRPKDRRITIIDELLQVAYQSKNGDKKNKQVLIDTSEKACKVSKKTFGNKEKYERLTANCEENIDDILYKEKIESRLKSRSFIFSNSVIEKLKWGSSVIPYKMTLRSLSEYGSNYLFVVFFDQLDTIPFYIWLNSREHGALGMIYLIQLNDRTTVLNDSFCLIEKSIKSIDKVISKIVPGLNIEINDIGKSLSEVGKEVRIFDVVSVHNGVKIPLRYESDGIKRIISYLSVIVAVYNNPSVTVAIDEMDSGVFEYMLGELLRILKDSAKGQLIFTSHNLRPLEVLPYKNLLFTTKNPEKRFAKLEGVSGNNNLRDSYFRSIILGSGKDAFYDATDTFEIEQALFEAGAFWED